MPSVCTTETIEHPSSRSTELAPFRFESSSLNSALALPDQSVASGSQTRDLDANIDPTLRETRTPVHVSGSESFQSFSLLEDYPVDLEDINQPSSSETRLSSHQDSDSLRSGLGRLTHNSDVLPTTALSNECMTDQLSQRSGSPAPRSSTSIGDFDDTHPDSDRRLEHALPATQTTSQLIGRRSQVKKSPQLRADQPVDDRCSH